MQYKYALKSFHSSTTDERTDCTFKVFFSGRCIHYLTIFRHELIIRFFLKNNIKFKCIYQDLDTVQKTE